MPTSTAVQSSDLTTMSVEIDSEELSGLLPSVGGKVRFPFITNNASSNISMKCEGPIHSVHSAAQYALISGKPAASN